MTLAPRPCPTCDGVDLEVIYEQRFAHFPAGSIGDGYDVVACRACGMCFASGLPDPERFMDYYGQSSKYDSEATAAPVRDLARFADQAAFVAAHVPRERSVLDVGTATGAFLSAMRDAGFASVHGIEPSPSAVAVARDAGLDVEVGDLDVAVRRQTTFGVISYVAVLEHVGSPRDEIRKLRAILEPDGFLFVSVPDATAFVDRVETPFQEFSVEHINFFTLASLDNVLGCEGFERVAARHLELAMGTEGAGPAVEAVYRAAPARQWVRDEAGAHAVRQYVAACERAEAALTGPLAELDASSAPIYVWGTGTHTLHLLETSILRDCNIVGFIDSNAHYTGASLRGRTVFHPSELDRVDAPILVSSAASQNGIASAARARFGPDVQLIFLHR
jgi:SAM-dependent methyltransferase